MRVEPRADVALMAGYHSPQVDVAVRLNTNESPYEPPAAWRRELLDAVAGIAWHRYPDRGATELRAALAALHGVAAAQVFPANGSNEVLQTLLLAYGGHGRRAGVWEPTYALHSHLARITGTEVVEGDRTEDFALDLAEVDRVLSLGPAVAFLCSPNNPTGVVDDEALVRRVLSRCEQEGTLLVVDEAYAEFAPWSAMDLVAEERPLVVTRTFSKTWSMAAARLGYLVGPSWVVEQLDKIVLPYHLDSAKQLAGTLALTHVEAMAERAALLTAERARLVARLAALPVDVWPSGANFVLFRAHHRPGDQVWRELVARSVLVRDCSGWPRLAGCLRVTIGTPEEDDAFLTALEEVLA